ncbi:hypothetical protein BAJUN_00620 [Bajunvirus bajun]|uniref:Uncharacterized protein n=1 Tax=Brevundimonas phage vB_BgoS-Bajun TaxID=2948594 RepID=A0A9E7SUR3_9CAUD|nr:hypothetical protein BAJUN_00620 [Brevundimonas phage vB_BgoS-Bajun]
MAERTVSMEYQIRVVGLAWGGFKGGYSKSIVAPETPDKDGAQELSRLLMRNTLEGRAMFPDFQTLEDCEIIGVTYRVIIDEARLTTSTTTETVVLRAWDNETNAEMFAHDY